MSLQILSPPQETIPGGTPIPATGPESAYVQSAAKRLLDVAGAVFGLVVLAPLFLLIGLLIKTSGRGPVFFRQTRMGWEGRPFVMLKFRTMVPAAESAGPAVTQAHDPRVTWIGRWLRQTKLDELPQLWNVLQGEMSLVGPRPEVPRYAQEYTPAQRQVFRCKPGMTDLASLYFRKEERILTRTTNVEQFYLKYCVPRKTALNLRYAATASPLSDLWIILQTICPPGLRVLGLYGLILGAAAWLVAWVHPAGSSARPLIILLGGQLFFLAWRGQTQAVLHYFSLPDLIQTAAALVLGGLASLAAGWMAPGWALPASFVALHCLVALGLVSTWRVLLRCGREQPGFAAGRRPPCARVAIIGANELGACIARVLGSRKSHRVVSAFFDDNFQNWHKRIHNIPVIGMPECLHHGWADRLDEVIVALPHAAPARRQEIDQWLAQYPLKVVHCSNVTEL